MYNLRDILIGISIGGNKGVGAAAKHKLGV